MKYNKLRHVISEEYSGGEREFARRCGIGEGYFIQMLDEGLEFTGEELWLMALELGIANRPEAQEELFFGADGEDPDGVSA